MSRDRRQRIALLDGVAGGDGVRPWVQRNRDRHQGLDRAGGSDNEHVGIPPKGLSDKRSRPRAANTWPGPPWLADEIRGAHLLPTLSDGASGSHKAFSLAVDELATQ